MGEFGRESKKREREREGGKEREKEREGERGRQMVALNSVLPKTTHKDLRVTD